MKEYGKIIILLEDFKLLLRAFTKEVINRTKDKERGNFNGTTDNFMWEIGARGYNMDLAYGLIKEDRVTMDNGKMVR